MSEWKKVKFLDVVSLGIGCRFSGYARDRHLSHLEAYRKHLKKVAK